MRFSLPSENSIGATIPEERRSRAVCLVDFPSRLMAYQASELMQATAAAKAASQKRNDDDLIAYLPAQYVVSAASPAILDGISSEQNGPKTRHLLPE